MNKKSELLLPAGSLSKLKTAFLYGADAVYCGIPNMSLRANAGMSYDEVADGVKLAHSIGKKIYLALNLYTHNSDIPKLPEYVEVLNSLSPDGVIIADPGVFKYVKENVKNIPLFISTQANVCSSLTLKFWEEQGASLCVLGRETSFSEISEIKKTANIKIEMFIHGAMCMSYSGRCLLSNFLANRSANQGKCAQSCRWKYKLLMKPKESLKYFDFILEEANRPEEYMPIEEDDRGAYILNSKDMCLLPKLPQILDAGIDSLKIEGRNKSEYYVGSVARIYRKAIDDYYNYPDVWNAENYMQELHTIQNRGYTYGFFDGELTHHANNYETTKSDGVYRNIGFVKNFNKDYMIVELRNNVSINDTIEILSPREFTPLKIKLNSLIDGNSFNIIESGKLSAGHEKSIAIPFSWIYKTGICNNTDDIKKMFPVLTLLRKFRNNLTNEELEELKKHSSAVEEMKLKI